MHRYYVCWDAPSYRHAGSIRLLAKTKLDAIKRARKRLGARVNKQSLRHFDAWRV